MSVAREVAGLERLTVRELQNKFAQLFGEATSAHHKQWLIKRIAWRMQALAEGGISERARRRAVELADDADLRLSPPKVPATSPSPDRTKTIAILPQPEGRLPVPGTVIVREYKGRTLQVKVLPQGFEFEGAVYRSLSAVAKSVTGSHCNGYFFFRVGKEATR
jgi:hypothetical protein